MNQLYQKLLRGLEHVHCRGHQNEYLYQLHFFLIGKPVENVMLDCYDSLEMFIENSMINLSEIELGEFIFNLLKYNTKLINQKHFIRFFTLDKYILSKKMNPSFVYKRYLGSGYLEGLPEDEKKVVEQLFDYLDQEYLKQKEIQVPIYNQMMNILEKSIRQKEDYIVLIDSLKQLSVPFSFIHALETYLLKQDRKQISFQRITFVQEELPPKEHSNRYFKQKLDHYLSQEVFDFANLDDLFVILKELDYPYERKVAILKSILYKKEKNYYYYRFLYQKIKYYLGISEVDEEIKNVFPEMMMANDEDYVFWKNHLMEVLENAEPKRNFKYELELIKAK